MKGAIGYARVSTDEQAKENNSLAVQKKRIAGYCETNAIPLVRVFEASESGRSMLQRPVLDELLEFCRKNKNKISHVIVCELSRLARNNEEQAFLYAIFEKLGFKVISIDEPNATEATALGAFLRNMVGSINQLFSDELSERTRVRMQEAVKSGKIPLASTDRLPQYERSTANNPRS